MTNVHEKKVARILNLVRNWGAMLTRTVVVSFKRDIKKCSHSLAP